ncbi:hypothetical protein [Ekhidna sp.]|uniref:hypothetical protein n=1 Tax=Ekhidna sp. TaxID=2608089 RepID=UPI003297583D
MKNLLLIFTITLLVFITSCGKDDGAEIQLGLSGAVTFDGTATTMSDGLIIDFGADAGEYNYDFYIANGNIAVDGVELTVSGNTLIYLELYNEGTAFSPGTFAVAQSGAKYCFASIRVDDETNIATGGTVTVTGSGQNYEAVFNLEFSGERTLTGTVEGGFALQGSL